MIPRDAKENSMEYGMEWTWNPKNRFHPRDICRAARSEQHERPSEDYGIAVCRQLDRVMSWKQGNKVQAGDVTVRGEEPRREGRVHQIRHRKCKQYKDVGNDGREERRPLCEDIERILRLE